MSKNKELTVADANLMASDWVNPRGTKTKLSYWELWALKLLKMAILHVQHIHGRCARADVKDWIQPRSDQEFHFLDEALGTNYGNAPAGEVIRETANTFNRKGFPELHAIALTALTYLD
ncbi:hypothetical protein [Nisaea sp.]|uniref:hypothetical protein n=1 Tax=Nisaea sp. TaxID=2024842 RepID=UPI00326445B9